MRRTLGDWLRARANWIDPPRPIVLAPEPVRIVIDGRKVGEAVLAWTQARAARSRTLDAAVSAGDEQMQQTIDAMSTGLLSDSLKRTFWQRITVRFRR